MSTTDDAVVLAIGTFDLFHYGHVRLLERASRIGVVAVALNSDDFAERYKRRPVMTLDERMEVVAACEHVEWVTVNEGDEDSKPVILRIKPTYIVHGDDWQGKSFLEQLGVTEEWLEERHISVVYLSYTDDISTADIINRVKERYAPRPQ